MNKKIAVSTCLSIITLYLNGLNVPIKTHGITEWITKQYPVYKRLTLKPQTHTQTRSKGLEKIFHANGNEKKAGLVIITLGKIDFKTKAIITYPKIKKTFKNDKGITLTKGHNPYKHLCT